MLQPHLGTSWSQLWAEAGFASNSCAAPKAQADRAGLLLNLRSYFTAYPAREVAQLGVTAAAAASHNDTLAAARGTVNHCHADLAQKKTARSTAEKTLRKRMRGLIAELKHLLPSDDARWTAFGLNRPAAPPRSDRAARIASDWPRPRPLAPHVASPALRPALSRLQTDVLGEHHLAHAPEAVHGGRPQGLCRLASVTRMFAFH